MFTYTPDRPTPALRRPRHEDRAMNPATMPSSIEAAERAYDRAGEPLELELVRMQALFPLEDLSLIHI